MKTIFTFFAVVALVGGLNTRAQEAKQPKETNAPSAFTFEGGKLSSFINEIKTQLGMDLRRAATIDSRAMMLDIPKMRVPGSSWEMVLDVYNKLSIATEESLGKWVFVNSVVSGNDTTPNAILFMPPRHLPQQSASRVKAFAMEKERLKAEDLKMLEEVIRMEVDHSFARNGGGSGFNGEIRYHEGTGLLIAAGEPNYVELATTIIEAFQMNLSRRGPQNPR